jgi:LuxR family maltose regulon positive regulatory protein
LIALQSPGAVNVEIVLTTLLNEITEFPDDVVLILDDYHVIESQPVDQTLTFTLDHLPPQMYLVIASRIDPSFSLSRLRVSGQMTEIRADNLDTPILDPAPTLELLPNTSYPTYVELPVVHNP